MITHEEDGRILAKMADGKVVSSVKCEEENHVIHGHIKSTDANRKLVALPVRLKAGRPGGNGNKRASTYYMRVLVFRPTV